MPLLRTLLCVLMLLVLSACGSGSPERSSGASDSGASGTFSASLAHATVSLHGRLVSASVEATYGGGRAGRRLLLRYGLVDAVSGIRASQGERVMADVKVSPNVTTRTFSVTFNPRLPADYIIHFSLETSKGVFVAGADSDVFTYPE